jgi:hypothetical protein
VLLVTRQAPILRTEFAPPRSTLQRETSLATREGSISAARGSVSDARGSVSDARASIGERDPPTGHSAAGHVPMSGRDVAGREGRRSKDEHGHLDAREGAASAGDR